MTLSVAVVLGDPRLPDATKVAARYSPEDLESVARMEAALARVEGADFTFLDDHATLLDDLRRGTWDLVLNFCDTGWRNDATRELHLPAWLEMHGIPYSGAGPACLALAYDKAATRALASALGVPVPREVVVAAGADAVEPPALPALVKPRTGDGSVGIDRHAVARTRDQVIERVARLRAEWPGRDVLVQEFLEGDEVAIGLVGNPGAGLAALPALAVDYAGLPDGLPRILSYESKTVPDSPYWTEIRYREARLPEATAATLEGWAKRLFAALGCRDAARFDFRADAAGGWRLLEANPNPAWCWDGKMCLMAGFAGIGEAGYLERILDVAVTRTREARDG